MVTLFAGNHEQNPNPYQVTIVHVLPAGRESACSFCFLQCKP